MMNKIMMKLLYRDFMYRNDFDIYMLLIELNVSKMKFNDNWEPK